MESQMFKPLRSIIKQMHSISRLRWLGLFKDKHQVKTESISSGCPKAKQNQSRKKREEVLNNLIDVKKSTLYFPNYLLKNKAQTSQSK